MANGLGRHEGQGIPLLLSVADIIRPTYSKLADTGSGLAAIAEGVLGQSFVGTREMDGIS